LTDDRSRSEEESYIGEGVFGVCSKKLYRGIAVAVKQFKANVSVSLVKQEASVLSKWTIQVMIRPQLFKGYIIMGKLDKSLPTPPPPH